MAGAARDVDMVDGNDADKDDGSQYDFSDDEELGKMDLDMPPAAATVLAKA
jgi:hypothetical protein